MGEKLSKESMATVFTAEAVVTASAIAGVAVAKSEKSSCNMDNVVGIQIQVN